MDTYVSRISGFNDKSYQQSRTVCLKQPWPNLVTYPAWSVLGKAGHLTLAAVASNPWHYLHRPVHSGSIGQLSKPSICVERLMRPSFSFSRVSVELYLFYFLTHIISLFSYIYKLGKSQCSKNKSFIMRDGQCYRRVDTFYRSTFIQL